MKIFTTILLLFILYTSISAINPMKEYTMKPDDFEIPYQEHKLTAPDNYDLNTWYM